jgi:hypothetical protein
VRESVSNQKKNLKNQQAGSPNGRSTAEYGQNQFAEEQLHKEEKKSADENRDVEDKTKIRRRAGSLATLLASIVIESVSAWRGWFSLSDRGCSRLSRRL